MSSNDYKNDERFYDLDDLDDSGDEDERMRGPVPLENLISAASFVVTIISEAGIHCGVLGGLGVALNGIGRETKDVDIGIISKNWRAIRAALEKHLDSGRLKIPRSKLVADYLRVFCRTGAPWDDCGSQHEIEVDILSKLNSRQHDIDAKRTPPVFTLPALFRFKLQAYSNRRAQRDLDDMDSILRNATREAIFQLKDDFKNIGVYADVIEEIDEEYVDLKKLLHELLE